MQKFEIPSLEGYIIDIRDDMRFKTKIKKGTGTQADGKLASEICLQILDQYEIEDLATHFTHRFNKMMDRKIEERKTIPYPFGPDPTDNKQPDDVA